MVGFIPPKFGEKITPVGSIAHRWMPETRRRLEQLMAPRKRYNDSDNDDAPKSMHIHVDSEV